MLQGCVQIVAPVTGMGLRVADVVRDQGYLLPSRALLILIVGVSDVSIYKARPELKRSKYSCISHLADLPDLFVGLFANAK